MIAVLVAHRRARALAHASCSSAVYGAGTAFFGAGLRRDRARRPAAPRSSPQANSLDQFVRPDRAAARRPGARRLADRGRRRRLGVRARRGDVRRLGRGAAGDAPRRAARTAAAHGSVGGDIRERLRLRPQATSGCGGRSRAPRSPTCCSWARPRCCCRSSSRTTCTAAPPTSGWSSPPAASARSAARVVMGQRGLPRRDITFMYVAWTLATLAVAGYGLATAVWQLMLASLAFNALETAGTIVWATAKQRHVPPAAARPRLEPRLADLDRAAAAVVRADRAGERRDRRRRARWSPRGVVGGVVTFARAAAARHAGGRGQARRPAGGPLRRPPEVILAP